MRPHASTIDRIGHRGHSDLHPAFGHSFPIPQQQPAKSDTDKATRGLRLRQVAAAAWLVAGLGAGGLAAHAAAPAADFAVTAVQVQSLGVQVLRLEQPAAIRGLAYPARVVLPPTAEQVVSAPVGGVVDQLLVTGQESVRAGQALLRLVSPEFADMQLKLMEAASRNRLAQQTLAREKALLAEGIIPERRVQEADAVQRTETARLAQAQAELRLAGADPALVKRLLEGGAPEETILVRARGAGQVLGVEVRPGQRVHAADALVRLASLGELWLDITLPVDARPAMDRPIPLDGRDAVAQPVSLGGMANDSQTVVLRARVTRGAAGLRPGEVLQAQVPFPGASGWSVPLKAVTRHEGGAYVFVRSAKGFTATPVKVLAAAGEQLQVSGPLQAGQEIATTGLVALKAAWLGKSGSN